MKKGPKCMSLLMEDVYKQMFLGGGFNDRRVSDYPSIGQEFSVPSAIGGGFYWMYTLADEYSIKIHNFYFNEDLVADFPGHVGLSVCDYYSVSGEELEPYRRLKAGHVRFKNYENYHFKALIHKNIPIQTVEIEFYPAYYDKLIHEKFGYLDFDFNLFFQDIEWCTDFTEMESLLHQIWTYKGDGAAAKFFYDSMVSQAVSLIIEYNSNRHNDNKEFFISTEDKHAIEIVNKYIDDHFYGEISIDELCKIACFGRTKFKTLFKAVNGCSVTSYITDKRLSQAEALLKNTDLTIEQIASTIGYSNPSRFSALFKKNVGLYPSDFRKVSHRVSE